MRILRGIIHLSDNEKSSVVTIGNFDGVHRGHQAILQQLKQQAKQNGYQSIVILFEPQPFEFFKPQQAPARINSLREKLTLMNETRIDTVLVLRFDNVLANLDAEQFTKQLLNNGLKSKHVIVGDDFRFGKDRRAGFEELEAFGEKNNFTVEQTKTCEHQGRRISSSWVRELFSVGDFDRVAELLGRPYRMCGRVRHGDKRGRDIGYPTINMALNRIKSPLTGVFVTTTILNDGRSLPGVSNIGTRPVFNGKDTLLETHLFDFDEDLYGQQMQIEFHQHLRGEQKFDSVDELKKQIDLDAQNARKFFVGT